MGRYRPRKEIKTWFYRDIEDQARLIEFVDYLKSTRQLAKVVRDGLRLMGTLREGDLSVLFELFPGLQTQLRPAPAPDTDELKRQIDDLKRLIVEQGGIAPPPPNYPAMKQIAGAGVKLAAPPDDDDDDDLPIITLKKATTNADAGNNFLNSMLSLQ